MKRLIRHAFQMQQNYVNMQLKNQMWRATRAKARHWHVGGIANLENMYANILMDKHGKGINNPLNFSQAGDTGYVFVLIR